MNKKMPENVINVSAEEEQTRFQWTLKAQDSHDRCCVCSVLQVFCANRCNATEFLQSCSVFYSLCIVLKYCASLKIQWTPLRVFAEHDVVMANHRSCRFAEANMHQDTLPMCRAEPQTSLFTQSLTAPDLVCITFMYLYGETPTFRAVLEVEDDAWW